MNLSDFTPSLLSHEFAFATSSDDGLYGDDQEIDGGAWSLGKSSMPVSKIPDSGGRYYSEGYYYNSYYYAGNGNINAVPSRDTGLTMCVPSPLVTAEPEGDCRPQCHDEDESALAQRDNVTYLSHLERNIVTSWLIFLFLPQEARSLMRRPQREDFTTVANSI